MKSVAASAAIRLTASVPIANSPGTTAFQFGVRLRLRCPLAARWNNRIGFRVLTLCACACLFVSFLGACKHCFHLHCILKWTRTQEKCPLCRAEWKDSV